MKKYGKKNPGSKQKFWVRVMCVVLCALLAGGMVASVLNMLLQ